MDMCVGLVDRDQDDDIESLLGFGSLLNHHNSAQVVYKRLSSE